VRVLTLRPLIFNFLSDSSRSLHSRLCPIPNFLKVAHPAPAPIPGTAVPSRNCDCVLQSGSSRQRCTGTGRPCLYELFATDLLFWWPFCGFSSFPPRICRFRGRIAIFYRFRHRWGVLVAVSMVFTISATELAFQWPNAVGFTGPATVGDVFLSASTISGGHTSYAHGPPVLVRTFRHRIGVFVAVSAHNPIFATGRYFWCPYDALNRNPEFHSPAGCALQCLCQW